MSSLMYPKVFSDYMKRNQAKGGLLRYLPTPVYFYAMSPGQKFAMSVPSTLSADVLKSKGPDDAAFVQISIQLVRVAPLKEGHRNVTFLVNGSEQHVNVKDSTGKFVFDGPIADASDSTHVSTS